MAFCIPKHLTTEFKRRLKSGEINPEKLMNMTSDERNAYFAEFMGTKNAKEVNALFESKLLLKNQQQGIINWAKSVGGLKPEVKRDLLSKVEKMTKILQPAQMDAFLGDLAEKKLGIDVTAEEASNIADLSQGIQKAKEVMEASTRRQIGQPATEEEMAYGLAKVNFYNYVNNLKLKAEGKTVKERALDPVGSLVDLSKSAKSIKASLDVGALFRQGWRVLLTHPSKWLGSSAKMFEVAAKTVGGKDMMDVIQADILSRPTFDLMKKGKLAVDATEESFPTAWPEKIPGIGRLFKGSQDSFTAFQHKARADVFDKYLQIAQKSNLDLTDEDELKGIAKMVNSLTGRGDMGRLEPISDTLNNIFFSPRWVKSHFDTLLLHPFFGKQMGLSWFAQKQAAINLLKMIAGGAAIISIARALKGEDVEKSPLSSNFGKIKEGATTFDVSGGNAALAVLMARLAVGAVKSPSTGGITPLNTDEFGSKKSSELIFDFFKNKVSPGGRVILDLLDRRTFSGEKTGPKSILENLFVPLPITNYLEVKNNPEAANALLVLLADGLGISTNTFTKSQSEAEKLFDKLDKLPKEEANAFAEDLKESDPELYKDLKKVVNENKLGITPKDKYMKTLGVQDGERAQYIWDELKRLDSDEERNAYIEELQEKKVVSKDVMEQLRDIKAAGGKNELLEKAKEANDEKSMAAVALLYVKAFGVDPLSAIETLFTKEQLKDVRGGTVIMERMGIEASQEVKKKGGAGPTDKLDHIVPLQLGGNNSKKNLKIVTEEEWESYTPVENFLGDLLNEWKIKEKEARDLITRFKNKEITAEEIYSQYP